MHFRRPTLRGLLASFAAFAAIGQPHLSHADVTVSSDPVGYYRIPLTPGFQTVGVTLVHSPLVVSAVDSTNSDTITITEGVEIGSLLDSEQAYYVEVVEGPTGVDDAHVGHRLEVDVADTTDEENEDGEIIISTSAATTTIDLDVSDITGYRIELRKHVTLAEAFPPADLFASFDLGLADQLQVYTGSSFTAYYLVGGNGPTDAKGWTDFNSVSLLNNVAIPPAAGLLYKRSGDAPAGVELVMSGKVRTNPFVQQLQPGFNFVAEPYPVSTSFTTRATFPGDFTPSFDIGLADQVQIFNGTNFTTYFLGGDLAQNGWFLITDFSVLQDTNPVFDYRRSAFIKKSAANDAYRVPLSWSP